MEVLNNFKDLFLSVWTKGILGVDFFQILIVNLSSDPGIFFTEFSKKGATIQDNEGVFGNYRLLDDEYTILFNVARTNKRDPEMFQKLAKVSSLLQEFEMFSWKLPPKWLIVCTANPDSGEYSVTEMDDAMIVMS